MWIALQHIDCTDGIRAQEAEGDHAEGHEEDYPVVLADVLSRKAKKHTPDQGARDRNDEVQKLVLRQAFASSFGSPIADPVCNEACKKSHEDGANEDRYQA